MKLDKRKILIIAVVACVIALIGTGSYAYFTAQETVTNKFMISTYDPENPDADVEPDDLFSIEITETKIDANGNVTEGETTTEGNVYQNVIPGITVHKDPTIKNTGSYGAWVRVNVHLTNANAWTKIMTKHNITDITTLFGSYDQTLWYRDGNNYVLNSADNSISYSFYYNNELKSGESVTLFKTFKIPEELDAEDMASLAYFELKVTADAIQRANTGDNALNAFKNYFK